MKKFDIKDVFSWSNAEDAKQYIGKQGYFADNLNDLQECVSNNNFKTLFSLDLYPETDVDSIFSITESDYYYALFLPAEKVKEVKEEKKWRAFTLEEFNKTIPMGTVFKYRYKSRDGSDNRYVKSIYYHANLDCENGYQAVFFEDCAFNLGYCFEVMELFLNGKWQPFGIEKK